MADVSDVANTLVAIAAEILYPNGSGQPSVTGLDTKIYAGWPDSSQIDADVHAAPPVCHVSIWPGQERNTTRYATDAKPASIKTPTIALTLAGQVVTVSGTPPVDSSNPHNLVVIANGQPYVYQSRAGDTLTTIALALSTAIAVGVPGTTLSGSTITLPNTAVINAVRVGVTGTALREVRRQERVFQIIVWADTPAHRDAIAQAVDIVLADTTRIVLPDDAYGWLKYSRSVVIDNLQKEGIYRRDLYYSVDYGTTVAETETQITQPQMTTSVAVAGVPPFVPVNTITF